MAVPAHVEPGNLVQLPAAWMEELGIHGAVLLDKTSEGILVRPCPRFTWDDIFATRLTVRPGDPASAPDVTEVSGDDLLF
jgi:antitoxin component of MazEF toxin-antitoxin module